MTDFNADDIARIATRLFNETPGSPAGGFPQSYPAEIPSHAPRPDHIGGGAYTPGTAHRPYVASPSASGFPEHPVMPGVATSQGYPGAVSSGGVIENALRSVAAKIHGQQPAGTFAAPASPAKPSVSSTAAEPYAGLKRFVQQVRGVDAHPGEVGLSTYHFSHEKFPNLNTGFTPRPLDVNAIRQDFPVLHQQVNGYPLAWFDNAATTQKPQSVIDAISRYYQQDNSNIHRGAHTLAARSTDAYEAARQKVQKFLKAGKPEEIIFVRGTSEGINLIAQTYGRKYLQPGDEIVLSTLEHHANIVPWQMIARENQLNLKVIPVNDRGEILLEEYKRLLGPRTKLVALTQASNSLGTILPVQEMTALAKRHGARVLIDGAQSVSHMPVDVQQLGSDFFVFSGHKIFGPTGIGAVYASEEVQELMPPWQGGGNMIKNVTFEETTYSDPPAKFEAGTPNIADAIGLGAALDYVNQFGVANIGRYEHELLGYATERLSQINSLQILGTAQKKVSVISFILKNHSPVEVGKYLDQYGIAVRAGHHCSQPSLRRFGQEATVRPSFSFYNTFEEIDRLAQALKNLTFS